MSNNNTNESKRPTHAIYQVLGEGEKGYWIRIGAAWANRDGKGFSLKFDALPITGRTVIRAIEEREEVSPDVEADEGNGPSA